MQTVWRVQNDKGLGPYHGYGWSEQWAIKPHNYENGCPLPGEDAAIAKFWNELKDSRRFKFGFASIEQLQRWFHRDELEALARMGFKVVEVPAAEVHYGLTQVVYLPVEPIEVPPAELMRLAYGEAIDAEFKFY